MWLLFIILTTSCNEWRYKDCSFFNSIQTYKDSIDIISINKRIINDPTSLNSASLDSEADIIEVIDTTTFNLEIYFKKYSKLKRDTNLYYGYFYLDNHLDGNPFIYVLDKDYTIKDYIERKKETKIFQTRIDFESFYYSTMSDFLKTSSNKAKYHLVPEESPEGYLQYLYFHEMGELFALLWHSSYDSRIVICSKYNLIKIIDKFNEDNYSEIFPKDISKLKSIDPTPRVKINRRYCRITWYELEYWHGVYERTYKIKRSSRYKVEMMKEKQVARIQNNIIL
jgi:hypothetical protein